MYVLSCIVNDHDLRLVLIAGLLCFLSALAALRLYENAAASSGRSRAVRLGLTGLVAGTGIWATHFIGMLAYTPALPHAYDPLLTGLSLGAAVALTAIFLAAGLLSSWRGAAWLAGAGFGLGVGVMHYTGMTAFGVAGHMAWDASYVLVSVALGVASSALALGMFRAGGLPRLLGSAALLTLAICGLHFTGMAAITITPDASVAVRGSSLDESLGFSIAAVVTVVLLSSLILSFWDVRARRTAQRNLQDLADAAVEGLVTCHNGRIADINQAFRELTGFETRMLEGRSMVRDLIAPDGPGRLPDIGKSEVEIVAADGTSMRCATCGNARPPRTGSTSWRTTTR